MPIRFFSIKLKLVEIKPREVEVQK